MHTNHLSWQIGEVQIIQLVELVENKLFNSFITKATKENVKKINWLRPHFADEQGNLKANVQSFLVKSSGKNILVDTCNGNEKERPNVPEWSNLQTDFLSKFKNIGIDLGDIDFVICTHMHFDHVGWNTCRQNGQWIPTFSNAKYIFSKGEYEYWNQKPENEIVDDFNGIDDSITPIIEAGQALLVEDDYVIDQNIRLISTPGHTPHHVSIAIESDSQKATISGDVIHHPCQMVNPNWTTEADTYPEQTVATRERFLNEIKDTHILLVGSHFANPVAGYIKSQNDELRFEVDN